MEPRTKKFCGFGLILSAFLVGSNQHHRLQRFDSPLGRRFHHVNWQSTRVVSFLLLVIATSVDWGYPPCRETSQCFCESLSALPYTLLLWFSKDSVNPPKPYAAEDTDPTDPNSMAIC
jgi:hypothetical protein